ncbi:TIGR03086 family metal-binding protein [Arthrobacter sp. HS15c]|uniref:TIGR03086 family metal-binding protein n=1 Tax=Arthrobacter sp. HS15c TaxID=3230279 RepID=UPI0034677172
MSFDKTILLPVDADEAFALITQPERLRRWKTVAARVDLRVGGEYRWTIVPGHHAAGTFQEIEPGKRIVFTWGWESATDLPPGASTVIITLEPVDGGTSLRLVHEGLTPEQSTAHAEGWNHFLGRLVKEASSDAGRPGRMGGRPGPHRPPHLRRRVAGSPARSPAQAHPGRPGIADAVRGLHCPRTPRALAGSLKNIGTALGADVTDRADAAPEVRIAELAQPTLEAFARRGVDGTIDMGFAELPATMVASILNLELLVHAWDFAKASGQDLAVSDVVTDYVEGLALVTISEQVRSGGSFAPAQPVAETAGSLERLIAFTGRTVTV